MENTYSSRYNLDDFSNPRPRANQKHAVSRRAAPKKSAPRRAPARPARSERKGYPSRKPSAARKRRPIFTVLIIVLIVGLIFGIGIACFNMYREYRKGLPFTYSDGVTVSGIDIGQLSVKEARAKLVENSMSTVKDVEIKVTARGKTKSYNKNSFKYTFDYDTPLKAAKIYSLKEQGIYEQKKGETEAQTESSTDKPEFTLSHKIQTASIKKQVKKLAGEVNISAKNARVKKFHPFAATRFEYQKGSYGYKLDSKKLYSELKGFFKSGKDKLELNAKVKELVPDITVQDLQNKIVGLATASSVSTNIAAATHNMKIALEACNGSVIEPGDTWSFNSCTGDSNLESNGYKKAAVISERRLGEGVGGGICQASTIIFEAGLFSNMEIIERHNHYWASTYAYAGEDATINYPDLDLKMRNKTDYQMFIECRMEDGNRLRVNIWGYQDPDYDNIRLHSENYDIENGYYRTKTVRELFKDGEIIKAEVVCDSYYNIKTSVKTADDATYRTTVNGYSQSEEVPYETVVSPPDENSSDEGENTGGDEDSEDDENSGEGEENSEDSEENEE